MTPNQSVLGIDAGSVGIAVVQLDGAGEVIGSAYGAHQGDIPEKLIGLLRTLDLGSVAWVAATSATPSIVSASRVCDSHLAYITTARHLHPEVRTILIVGGERFSRIRFGADGRYLDIKTNSSCAAGTGSFLDQQARMLGLDGSAELAACALAARGDLPKIASRCAVFAKTDLIHAQQEGYAREEICAALCKGLAATVADALFSGAELAEPIVFAGGVAHNDAVRRHLSERIGHPLHVDRSAHLYGALGAALALRAELDRTLAQPAALAGEPARPRALRPEKAEDLVVPEKRAREYFYRPLELELSSYPDFSSERHYEYRPRFVQRARAVEVDIYLPLEPDSRHRVFLGIDIGSTSTKAVLLDERRKVLAGFYTWTSGRPLQAVQSIFEAIHAWAGNGNLAFSVLGAGTTGSGRKFIGAIIGADLVVDEITAHARAAYELDPETDTIIEIGGQDAKFTTLRDGVVTSATMNAVCAAGTGSFIEEQARRVDCALTAYAERAAGARAPMASDRCTVFMQRDVNHLLGEGYAVDEVLAAVLHSVRENYLHKIGREGSIGERVAFQGATAKNRALVAAFEQRLGRPISVSRYCHLTGALGVAILLCEEGPKKSGFRGFELFRREIPIRHEICGLCNNHCKIASAEVMGERAAYGFLCGRDYDVDHFVSKNRSGFDMLAARRRIFRSAPAQGPRRGPTVGIPAALHLIDDLPLWRAFFEGLGARVVTSERCPDPVATGKKLAQAEFCAPMAAYHAHVAYLAEEADWVFTPIYLEAVPGERGARRQYCYYTQYASALLAGISGGSLERKLLRPLVGPDKAGFQNRARLYIALRRAWGRELPYAEVASALKHAVELHAERRKALREILPREVAGCEGVSVVLLGRPYSCLAPAMNKGIPDILASMGVKVFYQDMLPYRRQEVAEIAPLLEQLHWNYAASVLEAAQVIAKRPGLYPVLVTSFKCAPDSCTLEYFRRILDAAGKPYLVLELDEHDSSVGYETRIEAALRAFRNHHRTHRPVRQRRALPVVPLLMRALQGRKLFLPNWDSLSCRLVAANLRREGVDAEVLPESELTIKKGLRLNTGQCLPLSAIVQGYIDRVGELGLDPAATALWMLDSQIACNLGMFASLQKALLESHGRGFEKASVYVGDITLFDLSPAASVNTYFAYLFGGLLRRLGCRVRPYQRHPGEAERALEEGIGIFEDAFLGRADKLDAARRVVDRFAAIEVAPRDRPRVAIFGDLYTRDNETMNQGLIRFIEAHGGEVVTTPYSDYAKIVARFYFSKWLRERRYLSVVLKRTLLAALKLRERRYAEQFARVLGPLPSAQPVRSSEELLGRFGVTAHHTGESLDNLLKVFHILENDPEVSLFVQASPAFCCPSLVTEAMARRIEEVTGVPVLSLTYDGTAAARNDAIIPHLRYPRPAADAERGEGSSRALRAT